jgi:hypothetical protein
MLTRVDGRDLSERAMSDFGYILKGYFFII